MKNLPAYLSLIILLGVIGVKADDAKVPIEHQFKSKIVYTTDQNVDIDKLHKDCQKRHGHFQICGSICDGSSGSVPCPAVCAFTCELVKR